MKDEGAWPERASVYPDEPGMSASQKRDGLFALSTGVIVVGVGLSFGMGAALIVAGLFGVAVAVAWAYVVTNA